MSELTKQLRNIFTNNERYIIIIANAAAQEIEDKDNYIKYLGERQRLIHVSEQLQEPYKEVENERN